jgi:hypothetical protein
MDKSGYMQTNLPEFKVNASKNGYEIRTEILGMAKDVVQADFNYKIAGWEMSNKRDEKGNIITTVEMPTFPGLDTILETAERMYSFVNRGTVDLPKVDKKSTKAAS